MGVSPCIYSHSIPSLSKRKINITCTGGSGADGHLCSPGFCCFANFLSFSLSFSSSFIPFRLYHLLPPFLYLFDSLSTFISLSHSMLCSPLLLSLSTPLLHYALLLCPDSRVVRTLAFGSRVCGFESHLVKNFFFTKNLFFYISFFLSAHVFWELSRRERGCRERMPVHDDDHFSF